VTGFKYEKALVRSGRRFVAGVDEVGRGALCGPVVGAAVILPVAWFSGAYPAWVKKINDSKLLSPTNRKELAVRIVSGCESFGIGFASCAEVDEMNVFVASCLAMKRAVEELKPAPDHLLVDGVELKNVNYEQTRLIKGDRKSRSIGAASILAKVFRDTFMETMDRTYGGYGLARNKGYATAEHYRALREKGPTPLHRRTFRLE